jgi:hypothetical protein
MRVNQLSLVRAVIIDLQNAGFQVLLIGGWAEELQGLADRRPHEDVDVVLLDPNADALDSFVAQRDEVVEKRLSQKRAYRVNGVLVELFVARSTDSGYKTVWWDRIRLSWDADMSCTIIEELPVASIGALTKFRESYAEILAARPR